MAVSDLGGLGAKEGSPVVYNWTRPNPLPVLLPWLAVLLLLLLKPNRCAQAWWIWVPVGCVAGAEAVLRSELGFIPSSLQDMLGGTVGAVGFGLAAVWLIAGYLGWKHRAVAWVGTLLALGGMSLLAFVISQGLEGVGPQMFQGMILLAAGALVISLAITLAGLVYRGRYGVLRLCLWLITALLAVWLLLTGPFFAFAMIFSPSNVPVLALVGTVFALAGVSFGVLLPFLVLSFVNAFYRARLKDLLHVGREADPPVIAPVTQAPRLLEVEP